MKKSSSGQASFEYSFFPKEPYHVYDLGELEVTIQNTGNRPAQDIVITWQAYGTPAEWAGGTETTEQYTGTLEPGQQWMLKLVFRATYQGGGCEKDSHQTIVIKQIAWTEDGQRRTAKSNRAKDVGTYVDKALGELTNGAPEDNSFDVGIGGTKVVAFRHMGPGGLGTSDAEIKVHLPAFSWWDIAATSKDTNGNTNEQWNNLYFSYFGERMLDPISPGVIVLQFHCRAGMTGWTVKIGDQCMYPGTCGCPRASAMFAIGARETYEYLRRFTADHTGRLDGSTANTWLH